MDGNGEWGGLCYVGWVGCGVMCCYVSWFGFGVMCCYICEMALG